MDVELTNVSKVYGRSFALHRINLTLKAGELTVILGHNGAGKTTMLNMLATVDRPSRGSVRFGNHSFRNFAKNHRRKIGWVSHDGLVYNDLTGRENLTFFASMYGLENVPAMVETWLERVNLADAADQRVKTYSRGMRQRLSIARALLHSPELILLDEPLTGLDPVAKSEMLSLFSQMKDDGATIIMITHDVSIETEWYDRVIVLRSGKMVFDGTEALAEAFTEHAS